MKFTKRERWLMERAFDASEDCGPMTTFARWLDEDVDDQGHTVEELLAGTAPKDDADGGEVID